MAIPERRKREIRDRAAERHERYGYRVDVLTGLDGADPTELYDQIRRDVPAIYNGRFYSPSCAPRTTSIHDTVSMDPDTVCAGCNRPIGEH